MHIRAQNAALIVRRLATANLVQFEVFEVLPLITAVTKAEGKLLCSYPGPAVQISANIFTDSRFLRELSSFLVQMDTDHLDSPSDSVESPHPRYISELLVGILRGCGQPVAVDRITKRIGDEVLRDGVGKPWRRSPLWLILRVSLQSSLGGSNLYKPFILYFHARLLRICAHRTFPSELPYVMRIKMARRLSKLGLAHSRDVYQVVHDTAIQTEAILSKRWTAFQGTESISPAARLKGLDFVADSQISLHHSYNYLMKMLRSASPGVTQSQFSPSPGSRFYNTHDFTQFANGERGLAEAITNDPHIAIADFELSVERDLESKIATYGSEDFALDVIAPCIEQYFSRAKDFYGTNPEDISVMILTIMDLWMALDRLIIQACPLMGEYSPEIPSSFLHPLLLHRPSTLKRALRIEEYLCWRHREALEIPSIFSNRVGDSSFAVRYFCTSKYLQRLYDEINTHAQKARAAKRVELKQKRESLPSQARNIYPGQIHVHEWPLPPLKVHAQLAVFELSPPRAFSVWRDITYMILRDIGFSSFKHVPVYRPILLHSSSGLKRWSRQLQQRSRVTLASTSPLSANEKVDVSAEESSIFINNRLSFRFFDRIHESWVVESLSRSSPTDLCIPPITKSSPYNHLHRFVSGTQHTPNDIITAQADCPQEINLHEFISFSGLRSGPRLQWLNIARELASSSLSFSREEVHTLITQAAWQLGPLSNGVREWHIDLCMFGFGNVLLCEMECLLEKIKANWLEEVTVRTIGMLESSHLLLSLIYP
jgi:hypothetical protein